MTLKDIIATASPKADETIKSVTVKSMNRARIFWKVTTVIFFLTTVTGAIAWKIETYGRSMDAKVIRLETEKALLAPLATATTTSTVETTQTPPIKK